MTQVTAQMSVSLDGFYAGPEHTGETDWLHGTEAAGFFLAVAFPSEQVRILPYNRIVTTLGMAREDFLRALAAAYAVEPSAAGIRRWICRLNASKSPLVSSPGFSASCAMAGK